MAESPLSQPWEDPRTPDLEETATDAGKENIGYKKLNILILSQSGPRWIYVLILCVLDSSTAGAIKPH
ncbi:hypothetical protein Y1Q_0024469 [Alligator mississippiensis]|uniref:Uncharacterized protein n=1 Tax=Alligator mississippiensis TaxID=8496 RepID=A0A151NB45_ALLMI|nr:hypothetical protein Y1Q_0024469 [Alligator mississippiensis]